MNVRRAGRHGCIALRAAAVLGAPLFADIPPGFAAAPPDAPPVEVLAELGAPLAALPSGTPPGAGGAGHDGRFYLASADGAFRLNVGGIVQFRYLLDIRDVDGGGPAPADDLSHGFQTRRTKLIFDGTILSEDWKYNIIANFSRSSGRLGLQDAWVERNLGDGWKVRFGQLKLPLLREELVGDQLQLTAERSFINFLFTQDRSQGVVLMYDAPEWNAKAAFSDGLNSDNTDLGAPGNTAFVVAGAADYAFTGRVELKPAGDWKQFSDFTSPRASPLAFLLGAAAHIQQSPNTGAPTDTDRRIIECTLDASLEGDGWTVFGAVVGRNDDLRSGAGNASFNDFGAVLQGGVRVTTDTEVFARWEGLFADDDRGLSDDLYHWVTIGATRYFAGHALKLTADAIVALTQTADLASIGAGPDTGTGPLGSDEAGEVTFRVQFQLLF